VVRSAAKTAYTDVAAMPVASVSQKDLASPCALDAAVYMAIARRTVRRKRRPVLLK
jgi:hypothetical protein